ncbi:DUF3311 domain-containing protein [Streptomyces sp. NPDC052396]|uniref:DUF3311 domain-containing protein n=1 Tax=Streptomyces sp. NPDC052396 TaxID=3365689 RepID=UPI0037D60D9D
MSEPPEGSRRQGVPLELVWAGICLAIPFGAMLWVDSYARIDPKLIGIPFFYWYQMLWVLLSTGLTVAAYALVKRHQRARRDGGRP